MRGSEAALIAVRSKQKLFSLFLEGSVWYWIGFIASLVAVVVLIWLVVRVRTWLRDDAGSPAVDSKIWIHLKELKQEGHLSEQEFRSINSRMLNPDQETSEQKPINKDDKTSSSLD